MPLVVVRDKWLSESEGQCVPTFLLAAFLPQTDQSSDSFLSLCHREGRTFLRRTSSRRRWWWRGGWGTWGSWALSFTGSVTAEKLTASDAAASANVSWHIHFLFQSVRSIYEMLNNVVTCAGFLPLFVTLFFTPALVRCWVKWRVLVCCKFCTWGGKCSSTESQGIQCPELVCRSKERVTEKQISTGTI